MQKKFSGNTDATLTSGEILPTKLPKQKSTGVPRTVTLNQSDMENKSILKNKQLVPGAADENWKKKMSELKQPINESKRRKFKSGKNLTVNFEEKTN